MELTQEQIAELEKLFSLYISEGKANKELALSMDYDGLLKDEIERYEAYGGFFKHRAVKIEKVEKSTDLPYTMRSVSLFYCSALTETIKTAIRKSIVRVLISDCIFDSDIDLSHVKGRVFIEDSNIKNIGKISTKEFIINNSSFQYELCEGIECLDIYTTELINIEIPKTVKDLTIKGFSKDLCALVSLPNVPKDIGKLDLSYNQITEADISQYTNLKQVTLTGNPIEFLKVPKGCQVKI